LKISSGTMPLYAPLCDGPKVKVGLPILAPG
jgi:hypothetical protein